MTSTTFTSLWTTHGLEDTELATAITPAVASAVTAVRSAFTSHGVHAWPDGQNGAFVVIDDLDLGPNWITTPTWLGFMISYLHPDTDCYPHYVRADLCRANGEALKAPFHRDRAFAEVPAVMVSRASHRRDPSIDTPARKAFSVLEFIRGQS